MKRAALIMAGGRGERFWPQSRKAMPKQFLCLTNDGTTMLQHAVKRMLPLMPWEDIYISTNSEYKDLVRNQLPQIPEENILCEPVGRNTAPCIGLGALHMMRRYGDAIMIVLPSDQLVKYIDMFHATLDDAGCVAEVGENLVTLGIAPAYPETGYGYIRFDSTHTLKRAYQVTQFVEKPDLETAKQYLASEQYLWNSGMFLWKCSTLMNNMEMYLPDIYAGLKRIDDAIGTNAEQEVLLREFQAFSSESVDYGIMERASHIYTVPCTFGWDDVGSWLAMERLNSVDEFGNVVHGNTVAIDMRNCIVQGNGKLLALVGVEDLVVVDSQDATLICAKNATQDVKKVLQQLKLCGKEEFL